MPRISGSQSPAPGKRGGPARAPDSEADALSAVLRLSRVRAARFLVAESRGASGGYVAVLRRAMSDAGLVAANDGMLDVCNPMSRAARIWPPTPAPIAAASKIWARPR